MFEQLLTQHQRHEATQKLILENQKKIKKVLLKNKVSIYKHNDMSHYIFVDCRFMLILKKKLILWKVLEQMMMEIYILQSW